MEEIDKVLKRQKFITQEAQSTIDKILLAIASSKQALLQGQVPKESLVKIRDFSNKVLDSHKDLQTTLQKYTKNLDKKFKVDLNTVWDPQAFGGKTAILNQALATHFIREGLFDLESIFEDESGVFLPHSFKDQFNEMFSIQESLKIGVVEPAIYWAKANRAKLDKTGSALEFQLHRLVFIQYLLNGNIEACLTYAKQQFPSFSKNHLHDIQRLMCAMLFSFRLSTSPYEDLIESHSRLDVLKLFTRNFCCLLGLPPSSPLFVSIMVGTTSLPTIIKMSSILKGNMALEWQSRGELPVEIPLLDSQRYHSVFTCPVSKEQSTNENPSMLLLCGHVIAKEALNRLGKGNMNAKFKCPYCPEDSTIGQCQRIFF